MIMTKYSFAYIQESNNHTWLKLTGKEISRSFRSKFNVTNNNFIPYQMCKTILTTRYHISIKMFPKSLIFLYFTSHGQGLLCDVIFAKHQVVQQLVYERSDLLTDRFRQKF